jgi:hypothetical protein
VESGVPALAAPARTPGSFAAGLLAAPTFAGVVVDTSNAKAAEIAVQKSEVTSSLRIFFLQTSFQKWGR